MVKAGDNIHLKNKDGVYTVVLVVLNRYIWVKGEGGTPMCVSKMDIHSVQERIV